MAKNKYLDSPTYFFHPFNLLNITRKFCVKRNYFKEHGIEGV